MRHKKLKLRFLFEKVLCDKIEERNDEIENLQQMMNRLLFAFYKQKVHESIL